jgi:hypothetical protein
MPVRPRDGRLAAVLTYARAGARPGWQQDELGFEYTPSDPADSAASFGWR